MQIAVKMTGRKGEKCPHRSHLFKIHFLRCPLYPMLLSNKRFLIRSKSLRWLLVLNQVCTRLLNSSENKFEMVYSNVACLFNLQAKSRRQALSSLLPLWVKEMKDPWIETIFPDFFSSQDCSEMMSQSRVVITTGSHDRSHLPPWQF